MGTTGSGHFEHYKGSGSGSGGEQVAEGDRCAQAIETALEDVATNQFYKNTGRLPSPGDPVRVSEELISGRIGVETAGGETLGFMPTRYNYVASECRPKGVRYSGAVVESTPAPVPTVVVHLSPE